MTHYRLPLSVRQVDLLRVELVDADGRVLWRASDEESIEEAVAIARDAQGFVGELEAA